jgi:hypothetical protein
VEAVGHAILAWLLAEVLHIPGIRRQQQQQQQSYEL